MPRLPIEWSREEVPCPYETSLSLWARSSEQASQMKLCLQRAQGVKGQWWEVRVQGETQRVLSVMEPACLVCCYLQDLARGLASSKHSVHGFKWINCKNRFFSLLVYSYFEYLGVITTSTVPMYLPAIFSVSDILDILVWMRSSSGSKEQGTTESVSWKSESIGCYSHLKYRTSQGKWRGN